MKTGGGWIYRIDARVDYATASLIAYGYIALHIGGHLAEQDTTKNQRGLQIQISSVLNALRSTL